MKKRLMLVNDGQGFKEPMNAFMLDVFEVNEALLEIVYDSVLRVNVLTQRSAFAVFTAMRNVKDNNIDFLEQTIINDNPNQNMIEMGRKFVNNNTVSDEDCACIALITTFSWHYGIDAVLVCNWYHDENQLSDAPYTNVLNI